MPKRQDNNICVEAENTVTQFVIDRHMRGIPGLPAQIGDPATVSLSKLSRMTGVGPYRLGLIKPLIHRLSERYGLETPAKQSVRCRRALPDGNRAADRVRDYYGNRPLPARTRIAKAVGLTKTEIDTQRCHDEITHLYKVNGREWGMQNVDWEEEVLESYRVRLREEGRKLPRLPGHREFDRQAIAMETGISVERLWFRDLKDKLELFDPPEKRATPNEIAVELERLQIFVERQIRNKRNIPMRGNRFNLTIIAHDVGIPSQRLHNVKDMRILIRMWASAL